MNLEEWTKQIPTFKSMNVATQMVAIGYYLHTVKKVERFSAGQVNSAFDELHLARPSNTSTQLKGLTVTSSQRMLYDSKGYRLTSKARDSVASLLPKAATPKQIVVELKALEAQIGDPHQKTFLEETITCFSQGAYRAAIVMAWNLAYHHACAYILDEHLSAFNAQLSKAHPKKKPISKHSDFEDLKESDVIEVAKGAQIFSKATSGTMGAKLDIRNMAAHPSSTVVAPITAEELITDLVRNVLLRPVL